MKYNTRPIDYTGCHPVIAEHLKRGEAIECWVWDKDCSKRPTTCHEEWIEGYRRDSDYPYRASSGAPFLHAEPIPRNVRRIMPPERAIPVLIAEGWEFTTSGDLVCPGEKIPAFSFKHFGQPYEDVKGDGVFWPPCIIEECDE